MTFKIIFTFLELINLSKQTELEIILVQKHFSIISKYFDGYKHGFLIRNAKMFKKPITYPGKLRFFEVNNSIIN